MKITIDTIYNTPKYNEILNALLYLKRYPSCDTLEYKLVEYMHNELYENPDKIVTYIEDYDDRINSMSLVNQTENI